MKVHDRVRDVETTLTGETVGMTIDQGALAHIMSVLTDLYSDPEMACIREYATNALDSQVVAGETRPIEVTTPTPLSPFLRIRDYGTGLNADDIRNIYSRYGTSTKRDSDDVVGMLGLGCKSALTYTDSFILTGIKDGVMTQVSIGRDENGAGSMTIVAEHPSDDPSGVEVTIPAKRANAFEQKAAKFFSYWPEGSVLLNGAAPAPLSVTTWIEKGVSALVPRLDRYDGSTGGTVVMGNVPYPIPADVLKSSSPPVHLNYNTALVLFVPIGAVNFTPSREALQMTKRTREALAHHLSVAAKNQQSALIEYVQAASSPQEAVERWAEAIRMGAADKSKLTFRGEAIPEQLDRYSPKSSDGYYRARLETYLAGRLDQGGYMRKGGEWTDHIKLLGQDKILILDGWEGREFTPTKRAKITQYLARVHPTKQFTTMFGIDALTKAERYWLNGATVVPWETIAAEVLPKDKSATTHSGRPKGAYSLAVCDTWGSAHNRYVKTEDITADKLPPDVVYFEGNRYGITESQEFRAGIFPKGGVVLLQANRKDKFLRDFPKARTLWDYAHQEVQQEYAKITPEQHTAAMWQADARMTGMRNLNPHDILDPDLRAAILALSVSADRAQNFRHSRARWLSDEQRGAQVVTKHPLDKYPLIDGQRLGQSRVAHAHQYVNLIYTSLKEDA